MIPQEEVILFEALPDHQDQRLDRVLGSQPFAGTRTKAEQLIKDGKVLLKGKTLKSSYKVQAGDQFEIRRPIPRADNELLPLDLKLDILFEDEDLIVINKASGLVVHPAAGHEQDTLVNALLHHTQQLSYRFGSLQAGQQSDQHAGLRPGIVHRLDKETSGVIVVAKNDSTHEALSLQFRNRSIRRIYRALCLGKLKEDFGSIESHLSRHNIDRKRFASTKEGGKWSRTNYKTVKHLSPWLHFLELKLDTGRTHQIRVHLSELGTPIVGDELYGANSRLGMVANHQQRSLVSKIDRVALHAQELGFMHPRTKEDLLFRVPWPEDLLHILLSLGLTVEELA